MRTAKRITTACLTAIMIFQALAPSTEVFAQELDAVMEASVSAARAAGNTARSVQDAVATALQDADQATSDDVATTPGADAGATEGGDGSTNAGESQDSTTDGTTNGDTPTEGDASQDDAAADEGAADGEQADDADADAADQANTAPTIATVEDLRHALGDGNVITDDLGAVTAITFGSNADLIAISNTDPAIYQNASISKTGLSGVDFDVCSAQAVGDLGNLAFQGFGSDAYPFKGTLDLGGRSLTANKTLFNNIELNDNNGTVKLTWKGTDVQPIVAAKVTGAGKTLSAAITVDKPESETEKDICKLTSPLVGEVTGALTLNATYTTSANGPLAVDMQSSAGNMGLLVNTLAEGASLTLAGLTLPDKLDGTPTINATAADANAGGLIGEAREGATVALPTGIDVSALSVAGKNAAGGLIGKATELTLTVGKDNSGKDASGNAIVIKPAYAVGSSSAGTYAGGLIGDASFADAFTINSGIFDFGKGVALSVSNTSAAPSAGGLFGVLDISNGDVAVNGGSYTSTLQNGKDDNKHGNYGGLVGKLWGKKNGDALHAFTVQGDTAVSFGVGSNGKLTYAGGLVGYLGEGGGSVNVSAVVISDATVTCSTSGYASANGKYGGAVGVVDTNNVLEVRGLKVKTASGATIGGTNGGFAGVVGSSWLGIVKFSGITDLSHATFVENDHTAQLIYENFNSLIFAAGSGSDSGTAAGKTTKWQYKRPSTPVKIDDVYSCGQVIRLGNPLSENLISINEAHQWNFSSKLVKTGDAFALASIDDFAKLAITWQTNGYYSMVDGVTENNLNGLQSSTITVNGTIDLKGTGLTGFTQDRADGSQVFSGKLNGNGTINLAVGEPYGTRDGKTLDAGDTSDGNGKIYRHGRLGLFNAIGGAAKVSNLTIGGFMKFDNGLSVDAGSLAASITGTADEKLTLSGVACETKITCDDTFGNDANIGGIAGSVSAAANVDFGGNSKAQTAIATGNTLKGNTRIGGAIGYVGDYTSTFNVTGLEVGGKIKTGDCAGGKIAQVGGLIGCIVQGSNEKNVNITGLSFSEFAMTVGKNGDKLNGAGGLLGYSWGNAIVTIGDTAANTSDSTYALKTSNNTTVTANSSTEVGGLVYAASGHWIINKYAINLANASFTANSATTLGVLIARGSTSDSNSFGAETSYGGLYLEDRAWWGTAYAVDGVSITAPKVKTYDEWLANGVKPESNLIDNGCNAVVSLHTEGQKLDMSGNPARDNSYRNRIAPANSSDNFPQTNGSVRYYYNLDKAYTEVGNKPENASKDNWMNSAEYLLLWCAYLYAPSAIQDYIIPENQAIFQGNNIGTSDSAGVEINLDGYSFYPTDPAKGSTVTVNNATITFHYSDIKAEQEGNKKNSEATQHENMHCALIGTHTGSLKVKNVTLAGTVGSVVNDAGSSSGALVCRYIYGPINETNVAQLEIDGLTLDGLTVDGVNGNTSYAPLLINEMQTCVNLSAKNISTLGYAKGATAATSLFGRLGVGKNSDQVTAKFERISLPSQNSNTIFTHASLLESFGYKSTGTGSADYTFTMADANAGMVTYGSEIDAENKEYSGKQLWYYDEATYGAVSGYVTVDGKKDGDVRPWFGDYLPYVYKGKATEDGVQYHEIKVNQRIPKLVEGCGTYGDPYAVKDATEMNAIANYINNSVALDGWEVTIAAEQSVLCTRRNSNSADNEVTYVYKQAKGTDKKWERKVGDTTDPAQTLSDETMHRYIQSAYYSIEPAEGKKITVDAASFGGFGNKANPFRGVIVGDPKSSEPATIEIKNNNGELRGLIPYSYGSVVRNLNINYVNAQATITYSEKDADGVPTAFFGGVIGCILGGDNIIDGVVVNDPNSGSTTYGFTVAGDSHLVPIGGYVGAIAGGGVIFRNTGTSWRGGTKNKKYKPIEEDAAKYDQYDNPYVGRVIDGYAFSEGCNVDNGDANYKINELINKGTPCVTTTGTDNKYIGTNAEAPVTTVENPQGLLVLSAIISSGAGAGAAHTNYADYGVFRGSKAYWGSDTQDPAIEGYLFGNKEYGKVRNASYDCVGKPMSAAGDFEIAKNDDQKAPGKQEWHGPLDPDDDVNSPYLVASYAADCQTGYVCASKSIGMSLEFKQGTTYDMTGYGTGYVGLNGRYYSNACNSNETTTDRDRITPHVATIDGNGATITVGTKDAAYGAVEYADDDYKVSGVGGLFSTVMFTSTNVGQSVTANGGAQVKDLTFSSCNVALTYIAANGGATTGTASNDLIGTGLLAGATANYDGNTCGVYRNVQMNNCTVSGAKSVGGLLGSSGRASRSLSKDRTYMVAFSDARATAYLYDCSYTDLNVTGEKYVGGYVGTVASACRVWTSAAKGVSEKAVGKSSTITATGATPYVGGVLGFAKSSNLSVNTNIGTTTAVRSSTAVISGVNVLATGSNTDKYMGAGGVVGRADGGVISMSNVRIDAGTGTKNAIIGDGTGKNFKIRNAGGLIGEVTSSGSPNKYWFKDCSVKNVNVAGTDQCSGGLIGYYFSNVNITCNNIAIENAAIKGSWSGGLLGAINSGSDVINVTNTKVSNTTFGGTSNGGIAGDGRGQFHLVNVLMDSNTYKSGVKQGVLLGEVDTRDNQYSLSAAGVDVKPGDGKTTSDLPSMVYTDNTTAVNKKTYIAFGDYNDRLDVPGKDTTLYGADDTATTTASPYVTTSPVSTLTVRASNDGTTDRYLFGDGAAIDTATTIQSQAGKPVLGRYTYTNINGINDDGTYQNKKTYSADSSKSTFNTNNVTSGKKVTNDFPVLMIPGNDTTTVEKYLNIVTNGGFSDARRLNGSAKHVTATAEVFSLADNGAFVKDATASQTPTLKVLNNGTSSMVFRASTDWDNERGRFTLLTVTFSEAGQSYRVQVPIIVKRMLEIDFTATYSEGANFKVADYATKYDKHVLVSSGDTMTGYLTWTYGSARGEAVDYGWNTLLEAGGSMGPLNKSITFGATLPEGTQLTLVDTAHNNREYHCTVGAGGAASVKLTDFVDSGNNAYVEPWLSEIVGVAAKEDKDGAWVKLTDAEVKGKSQVELEKAAGAKVGGAYYRARTSSDTMGTFYTLSVAKEEPKSENFYLVVRTPAGSAGVNGYTATTVDTSLNEHINYLLRGKKAADGKAAEDGHQNTASTYSVASNYTHNLVDNNRVSTKQMELSGATYPLPMDVSDTVTFDPNQQYTSSDALYYQLDSSLVTYHDGAIAGSVGYPTGTQGSYAFYVKVGESYYTWNGSGWTPAGATKTPVVSGLTWKSKSGGDMSLVLADANGKSIDMSGLREVAKNHGNAFTITMEAALTMSEPACQAGIVASQNNGIDRYTKPNYRAFLSTHADTLSASSNSAYTDGNAGYYRMDVGSSTIALEASKKSQLGINIDDLKSADGTIALVGTYDLSKLSGADAMISSATSVAYTLSLQQRQADGNYDAVDDISSYITVLDSDKLGTGVKSADGSSYVFTDTKAGDTFATRDGNSLAFKHAFRVKVNTDVETAGQTYANYRLVLTANMSDNGVIKDTPVNVKNLGGYKNSDYVTYTLARINTKGIPHGSN
ncbi:hypothetical protein AAAX73_01230 [Collinsella sp. CLA-ER-H9]|uniref:hypothetical protein n=1 Tax=Collinsella sp. CLA-ER-H9 TaxID=3136224 RepID=UPI0032C1A8DF